MKREEIERLAIDSAMGELNEDVEALFQTIIDGNPQAKQWADEVRQVYNQTEAAIKTKTAYTDVGQVVPKIGPVSRVTWLPATRWAAAIVFGMFIGFAAGRWEIPVQTQKTAFHEPTRVSKPVKTVSDLKKKYTGTFWGDKMLAMLEHKPDHRYRGNLRDIKSWDTYRQYMKGKYNE